MGLIEERFGNKDLLQNQNIKDYWWSASKDGFLMFSAKVLWMITKALGWILKKVATMAIGASFDGQCYNFRPALFGYYIREPWPARRSLSR